MPLFGNSVLALLVAMGLAVLYLRGEGDPPDLPETWWRPDVPSTAVDNGIHPFTVKFEQKMIDDLKHRLKNTRNLTQPLKDVAWTYGTNSKYLMKIIDYWLNEYDFVKRQAHLNKYPQYITNIQGLNIHFLRVRPSDTKGKKILPLLLQHGWPGSVVEFYNIIPELTKPREGYNFVFEVVAPSLPGFGFSDAASIPGLGAPEMAVVLKNLMLRLGHREFYTQGGDWGAIITANMATLFPQHVLGLHSNMCCIHRPWTMLKLFLFSFMPSLIVSPEEYDLVYPLSTHMSRLIEESGYFHIQATKPDTIGVGLSDSPAGLAAYILEKFSTATNFTYRSREDGGLLEKYTMDELLDNLVVYWSTNSATTAARIYAETVNKRQMERNLDRYPVKVPAACARSKNDVCFYPEYLLKDRFSNLVRVRTMPAGGHFLAMEEPEILAKDVWESVAEFEAIRDSKTTKKS